MVSQWQSATATARCCDLEYWFPSYRAATASPPEVQGSLRSSCVPRHVSAQAGWPRRIDRAGPHTDPISVHRCCGWQPIARAALCLEVGMTVTTCELSTATRQQQMQLQVGPAPSFRQVETDAAPKCFRVVCRTLADSNVHCTYSESRLACHC